LPNLRRAILSKLRERFVFIHRSRAAEEAAMKWFKPRFLIVLLLGLLITELAWAHGHHHGHHHAHVGIAVGVPLAAPWYYPPPRVVYAYPPVAAVQPAPQEYIEMNPPQRPNDSWWYYCHSPEGYYPYVKECPQGWQRVEPRPRDLR
jgi:hypothetical protein